MSLCEGGTERASSRIDISVQASGTPILDRVAPLPEFKAPGPGSALILGAWIVLILAIAAALAFSSPAFLDSLRQFTKYDRPRVSAVLALSVLAAFAGVAVHEIGHVLGGVCCGFRSKSLRIGPLEFHRPLRVSLYRGSGKWSGGWAVMYPTKSDHLVRRALLMVISGPAASISSGCLLLLLPFSKGPVAEVFILASVLGGLGDLLPFRTRVSVSDGKRIWMLLRQPALGERWVALMRLGAELAAGTMPESLPADYIAKSVAVRDNSPETVTAHSIAYSAAFHQHKDPEAASLLETCLAYSSSAAPVIREALMSDAAVFSARRRKRADIAGQWLAAMPARPQFPGLRARAEAAILEAGGEIGAALRKLEECERAILTLRNATQRETLLRFLRRWKSELTVGLDAGRAAAEDGTSGVVPTPGPGTPT